MAVKTYDPDRPPRRTLDKREAVRHLLHTAIRLMMKMEDPFAIHLLVHSADKILIDIAKKRGQELKFDWELYIKDEYHTEFFKRHRATYNYFKHADRDFADDLPVHDIMMINVMTLFIAAVNYGTLFRQHTNHMMLLHGFVMNLVPQIITPPEALKSDFLKSVTMMQTMTPSRYFETFEENPQALPQFHSEAAKDLQDIIDFYSLSFSQVRAGETKSTRIIYRIPEQ